MMNDINQDGHLTSNLSRVKNINRV